MSDGQTDPVLHISMPVSAWNTVLAHLQVGTFQTVIAVIREITTQASVQIEAAYQAEAAELARLAKSTESSDTTVSRVH